MSTTTRYAANGHFFKTKPEADQYIKTLGYRITQTETLRLKNGNLIHLLHLTQNNSHEQNN